MKPLQGKVVVVAGGTRGAGRGIAVSLGEAGATVYVTGRTVRGKHSDMARQETIEETAELVTANGGNGIAVRVDHTQEEEVKAFFERVKAEQNGKLDLLVNDIWGGRPVDSLGDAILGAAIGRRLIDARARHSYAYDHQSLCGSTHGGTEKRADHRDNGRNRLSVPRQSVLQLGKNLDDSSSCVDGRGSAPARGYRVGFNAGLPALGSDARSLWRDRRDVERGSEAR